MYRALRPLGVNVPNGFAVTAAAYWAVLDAASLRERIVGLLRGLDKRDVADLGRRGRAVCQRSRESEEI